MCNLNDSISGVNTEQINMVQIESIMSQITSNSDLREQWKESIILRVCVCVTHLLCINFVQNCQYFLF